MFRNKTGNWLDWKRGFLVVVCPSEASSMTWKSSKEDVNYRVKWPVGFNRHASHEVISGDTKFLEWPESIATCTDSQLCCWLQKAVDSLYLP